LALALGAPHEGLALNAPVPKPKPMPPVTARPRKFSVTEIERLVRNPYAVYARRILKLEPVPAFGAAADAALRGSLFHDAIALWNTAQAPGEESLIAAGAAVFNVYSDVPEIQNFWWPHFRRVAKWLVGQEEDLKEGLLHIHTELTGRMDFALEGQKYTLSARADRIDVLENGSARLIDYKTGKPPSADQIETGLSPQLTLETAILAHGGFANLRPGKVTEALYLRIAGGLDGLARQSVTKPTGPGLEALAQKHLAGLKSLLALYHLQAMPYLPRLRVFKEDDAADYDHLSRYREWQLAREP
jgi:ATP-dependent helicase/nuclease subunit B